MEPSWHSPPLQPPGGSNLPSDLPKIPQLRHPKLVGTARVRGTDQRAQGATQAGGTGAGWAQSVKHKGRKGGTGSSKCCSSSGSKKPPWDGSVFVLHWWPSAIPVLGFGAADISPDKGTQAAESSRNHQTISQRCQWRSSSHGAAPPPPHLGWIISEQPQAPCPPTQLQQ